MKLTMYSVAGFRDDFRLALRLATGLCAVSAFPLIGLAFYIVYTKAVGGAAWLTWAAYGQLIVVTFGGYYASAILATPVMFLARPVRHGYLGRGILAFVGITISLATMASLLLLLPGAGEFFARGMAWDPRFAWVIIRLSPVLGLFAAIFAMLQMADELRRRRRQHLAP